MLAALRPVAAPLASASRVAAVSRPAFARALPKAQIPRAFSSSPIRAQAGEYRASCLKGVRKTDLLRHSSSPSHPLHRRARMGCLR